MRIMLFSVSLIRRHYLWLFLLGILSACSDRAALSFVLVSLDTTRADHLGLAGHERDTTPFLDALEEEGLVFEQALTVSNNTLVAHASLFTGLLPAAHGTTHKEEGTVLSGSYTTLAEDFARAGYQTACFAAHPLWISERFGMNQGFERFSSIDRSADMVLSDAQQWLDERDESKPYFLFIHLFDVHSDTGALPYEAPEPFLGTYTKQYEESKKPWEDWREKRGHFLREVNEGAIVIEEDDVECLKRHYDEGLAYTDDALGRFLKSLDPLDNTYLFITADHGEEFMEHGRMLHDSPYDIVLRVPLIIVPPPDARDRFSAPRRIQEQVSLIDLRPTLASLAGLPSLQDCQGSDLVPWLEGNIRDCPSEPVPFGQLALRHDGLKLIRFRGDPQLYDIRNDPGEKKNLISKEEMRKQIYWMIDFLNKRRMENNSIRQTHIDAAGEAAPPPDPEAEEKLRALGYIR